MMDALELCIEQAVEDVFPGCRDDETMLNPYSMYSGKEKYPAWCLVSMYIEYGCDMDDLALELLNKDYRNRRMNRYPTIEKLYEEYNEMRGNPFTSGHKLRQYRIACEKRLLVRLDKL